MEPPTAKSLFIWKLIDATMIRVREIERRSVSGNFNFGISKRKTSMTAPTPTIPYQTAKTVGDARAEGRPPNNFPLTSNNSSKRRIYETMTDTPTNTMSPAATIAAANDRVLVTDKRGRVIIVRKLNALQFYNLTKAMGASANPATTDLAVIASSVMRIDTTDFAPPRTRGYRVSATASGF